jgi:hypothetical protein
MRTAKLIALMFVSAAFAAQASDGVELSMKTKAAAAMVTSTQAAAPFTAGRDPLPQILFEQEQESRVATKNVGTCEYTARDVCYDLADGRIVYRAARDYMPKIEGLKAESVSLRSHRLTFKYSFK